MRVIYYIPLPLISLKASLQMFASEIEEYKDLKIEELVVSCCGHPRSLEVLKQLIQNTISKKKR